MVDDDCSSVGQVDLFAAIAPRDQVDRGGGVMDDVDARRCAGGQRAVEPLEVLAHQAARQEVMALDRLTRRILHAPVADPAVALGDRPVVQTDAVAGLVVLAASNGYSESSPQGLLRRR